MFNASRLSIARKRKGWSKATLSRKAGISVRSVSLYENGRRLPLDETANRIASVLEFPVEFFMAHDIEEPSAECASFRALASMTAGQRDMALAAGALAIELTRWIDQRFCLPDPTLPDLHGEDPESAAEYVRAGWGIGEKNIGNMIHFLEAHGVRVYSLPRDSEAVNAFSFWHSSTPYVFLTTDKSGERGRFDAAHELGHLVLHRKGGPGSRDAELEADRFASAFLMPRNSVLASGIPQAPSMETLISAKRTWKVSLAALIYRLRHVNVISEWHYRRLFIELSKRGYRRSEPSPIPREGSQILMKVYAHLRKEGVQRTAIAKDLMIQTRDLDSLTFGLVVSAISGEGASRPDTGDRPQLELVK